MLLYLYGSDTYRRQRFLNVKIIAPFLKKHESGLLDFFDCRLEDTVERLENFLKSNSLFSRIKLGIVREVELGDKKGIKKILQSARGAKDTTLVVAADRKLPKAFEFLLEDDIKSWEFASLTNGDFLSFIKSDAKNRGLDLSGSQIKELALLFAGDLWGVVGEIEKLSLGGESDVGTQTRPFIDLIKTFSYSLDVGERTEALYFLVRDNEPAAVFNMAAAFSGGRKKVLFADYDLAVKSGKLEYEEALLALAI